jgi:aspartyl protease family protein
MVTLPKSVARQAGVDFRNAKPTMISTANGVAPAQRVTLNSVRLGGIRANLVEALVVDDQSLPVALLGMTFLNRTDMNRQGDSLTLKQRY